MNFFDSKKYKVFRDAIQTCLLLIIIVIVGFIFLKKNTNVVVNADKKVALEKNEVNDKLDDKCYEEVRNIYVDVKGAVKKPGVYLLNEGDMVNDAITAAGGLTKNGVTSNINLSKKVSDQMVIVIYTKKELINFSKVTSNNIMENLPKDECNCPTYEINECNGSSIINTDKEAEGNMQEESNDEKIMQNKEEKVNINTASKEELLTLSGIGDTKALAIIEYRNSNGGFSCIDDIKNVSGIGDSLFAKIKENITV